MVQVIREETYPQAISMSFSGWQIALTGALAGVLYVVLTYVIGHFVIDPLYCGANLNAANCTNSATLAGNISSILVGTIGLGVFIGLRVVRPIVVVAATTIMLWGLSVWTTGLWWGEVIAWSALLYALSYILFAWICRYTQTFPVIIVAILISVLARFVITL